MGPLLVIVYAIRDGSAFADCGCGGQVEPYVLAAVSRMGRALIDRTAVDSVSCCELRTIPIGMSIGAATAMLVSSIERVRRRRYVL